MALATRVDVEARLGRTVTEDQELVLVAQLLEDAEGILTARLPTLLLRAGTDLPYRARAVAVEAAAVVRVLRNPEGYRSESTGPFGYTLDTRVAAGFLTVLRDEWSQLGYTGASSINTVPVDLPSTMPYSTYDLLYGWR